AQAVMEVRDTGDGMSADEIYRITRESPVDDALHEGGIGLRNVIRRVSLATGGSGKVEIDSSPGAGTTVRVRLPLGGAS
ncbi:MAG: ATP-binding protein, partial [Spirochaetaceae bacterium]|nr:ATP-binding protein [Spirochaetaceae bacterium]